jgi:hypothetical protein
MNSRKMEGEKLHVYSTILFVEITNKQTSLMYLRETKTVCFVTLDWNHRMFNTSENGLYYIYHLL